MINLNRKSNAGFQLATMLMFILAITLVSLMMFQEIRGYQDRVGSDEGLLRAQLNSKSQMSAAEKWLGEQQLLPEISLEPLNTPTSPTIWATNLADYNLGMSQHPLTSEPMFWWHQGEDWWASYAHQFNDVTDPTQFTVLEFDSRLVLGEDIGQADDYKGNRMRILYRVTAKGMGPRQTRYIEQSLYASVVY